MEKRLIVTTIIAILLLLPVVLAEEYTPTLNYNSTEANYTNTSISISQYENTTSENITYINELSLIAATLIDNNKDRLDKWVALDNEKKDLKKNEEVNITFNGTLFDGDIIGFHIDNDKDSEVHICDASTFCSSPGYGNTSTTVEGFYLITLSGLSNPTNNLSFHNSDKFKLTHINATQHTNVTNSTTTYHYFSSIEVTTEDIEPANLSSWNSLIINETLNSQTITYQYSTDSGSNWNNLSGTNLSSINSSKLKFKVTLTSDGSNTPYLYTLAVNYTEIVPTNTSNTTNTTNTTVATTTSNTGNQVGISTSKRTKRYGSPAVNLPRLPPVKPLPSTYTNIPPRPAAQSQTVNTPQQSTPNPPTIQGPTGAVSASNSDSGISPSSVIAIGIMMAIGAGITVYSVKIKNVRRKIKRRKNHILKAIKDNVRFK